MGHLEGLTAGQTEVHWASLSVGRFEDLKAVAIELNETMTDEELEEMLAGATQQKIDN